MEAALEEGESEPGLEKDKTVAWRAPAPRGEGEEGDEEFEQEKAATWDHV